MNEEELKSIFDHVNQIPVDSNAKKRAVNLAMAEFAAAQADTETAGEQQSGTEKKLKNFQGFFAALGLTSISTSNGRRKKMALLDKKALLGGFAGVAVCLVVYFAVNLTPVPLATHDTDSPMVMSDESIGIEEAVMNNSAVVEAEPVLAAPKTAKEAKQLVKPEAAQRLKESEMAVAATQLAKSSGLSRVGASAAESRFLAPPNMLPGAVPDDFAEQQYQDKGRDSFEHVEENTVKRVAEAPVSTFSIDVDTASYSFVRGRLNQGVLPQKDAVRIEEMVNYFDYNYPLPKSRQEPFKPTITVTDSPWAKGKKLLHIGIKGYELPEGKPKKSNLVFLLDVSGSMNNEKKLPLVKQSLALLLNTLQPEDTVAIAVYAGAAGTVLEPTPVKEKQKILAALNMLNAGGSTAGGEGIKLAYQLAEMNFDKNAVNRIFLATDGDFNVGITNREELKGFVERKREKGIYLSVLGFGQGNYGDHMMQVLAQNGNGVAAYIDTLGEARKILVHEASSMLFPIAKDVKIQVEFNPSTVSEYRLIGYETRHLNREDFNNDAVDAGDIGAGHTVTAIYEIVPVGSTAQLIDKSRYTQTAENSSKNGGEYAFLKIRYKLPDEKTSELITQVIPAENSEIKSRELKRDIAFSTSVAGFSQLLKGSKFVGSWSYDDALNLAQKNKGEDEYGYRAEFVQLIRQAKISEAM